MKSGITIKQAPAEVAEELWAEVCPADEWDEDETSRHWVAYHDGQPVGFGSLRELSTDTGWLIFTAAAVLPQMEGHGLQRRLIRARLNWARTNGYKGVLTYTTLKNYPSMINLLKCGFRFYTPENLWAGEEAHYYYVETSND